MYIIRTEYPEYKVFAKFTKNLKYRTATQLRKNGNMQICLGTILMLNPGKSYPYSEIENEDKWYQCFIDR